MRLTLDLPEDLAARFGGTPESLERTALEALVLEGIRSGRITKAQGRRALGIDSRYEMDGFLKSHGVMLPMSLEDVLADADIAEKWRRQP